MVKIYAHSDLTETLGKENTRALVSDFRAYKEGDGLPVTFGRDVPYDFTHYSGVFCSDSLKEAIEQANLTGIHFQPDLANFTGDPSTGNSN